MDRRGKVGVAFRYWFNVRTGSGAPRTGLVAGDFAVTVRNPADSAESTPAVAESATTGGLYYFDVPGAFTTTNGVGEYGVTIAVTTAPLDVGGGSVLFEAVTLDDLAVAGDEMNLADDAITSAKYDETTAFPVAQADTGASEIARTGADGDTLETLSDQVDGVQSDTDDIQTRLPAALVGGRMDADVGNIQAGAVDAAAIATDAIDADALAASAVAEIVAALNDLSIADVQTALTNQGYTTTRAPYLDELAAANLPTDIADIQSRLPAALVGGAMDSDVSVIQVAAMLALDTYLAVTQSHGAGSWQSASPPAAATIATAVWDEALPGAHAAGTAGERLATTDDRVDQALSTTESNIRGADSDDLKDISDEIAAVQADTDNIQTRLPAALVGGAMDSDVSAIQAAALTAINNELEVTSGHGAGSWAGTATAPQVIRDAMKLAPTVGAPAVGSVDEHLDNIETDTSDMQPKLGTPAGASISADIAALQADTDDIQTRLPAALVGGRMDSDVAILQAAALTAINTQLEVTSGHGAGTWTTGAGASIPAIVAGVWGELVPGAFGAGSAGNILGNNLDVVLSTRATQADILSDATPFPGANIDAQVSSRSTPAQITAAQNAIIAELARLIISVETTAIAGSSFTEIRTGLTQANDFFNNMQVMVINAAGVAVRNVNDYANTNGAFTVDALPFTPAFSDPVIVLSRTGSVPVNLVAIAGAVWNALRVTYNGAGSFGESVRLAAAGLATDAAQEIRDEILSDSTPFAGANIDQSLSTTESNIRGADSDDLKDLSDQIDGVQADTNDIQTRLPAALVGGAMDSDVSNMQAATLTQINTQLEVTSGHGPGLWTSAASSSDWSVAEREQIRSALGIDGSKTAAQDGQLQQFHIAAIATVAAGGTAIEIRTDLTQANDFWNNMVMIVEDVGGTGERVARNIDDFTNTNGALYTFGGLPFTPAAGDKVYIVARTGSLRDDNGPIGCL